MFSPSSINTLRDKYADPVRKIRPSRIEALRAFFLKLHMETTQRSKYVLIEAVNLRQRMTPRLSFRHFGNIILIIKNMIDFANVGEKEIVSRLREMIKDVDMERVKKIQDAHEHLKWEMEIVKQSREEDAPPLAFTSLCNFSMYEVDMGWGKPAWVTTVGMPHSDMVSFWDVKDGESIEVYMTLMVEDMAKFEKNKELLSYVSSSSCK